MRPLIDLINSRVQVLQSSGVRPDLLVKEWVQRKDVLLDVAEHVTCLDWVSGEPTTKASEL